MNTLKRFGWALIFLAATTFVVLWLAFVYVIRGEDALHEKLGEMFSSTLVSRLRHFHEQNNP